MRECIIYIWDARLSISILIINPTWILTRAPNKPTKLHTKLVIYYKMVQTTSMWACVPLAESQKGTNTVQWCSVENQKGAITMYTLYSNGALLVLNGTSLNCINALLVLNWLYVKTFHLTDYKSRLHDFYTSTSTCQ